VPKKTKTVAVIVETPQGARSKVEFDYELGLLRLTRVLPAGMTFPLNFGSIPGTLADDGDPLDVLLFMRDPVPSGTLLATRPIGVMEAEQTADGETVRNDRLFAVPAKDLSYDHLQSVSGIEKTRRKEYERFFETYNSEDGKTFRPLGWFGPQRAWKLIDRGRRKYRRPKKAARLPRTLRGYEDALRDD
jgi:inorganic pyrophosphatase